MISEKWQHSMNRYLGIPLDSDFFDFYIQPGICKEIIGKFDKFYSNSICIGSNKIYCWSEFHAKKINSIYATCPFLFDLARVAIKKKFNSRGSLFFLPREDRVVKRNNDMKWKDILKSAPQPITILSAYRKQDFWNSNLEIAVESLTEVKTRQFRLSELLLSHEYIYVPLPSSDTFYANFLNKKVIHYDNIENYSSKKQSEIISPSIYLRYLNWSYEKTNEIQKKFFEFNLSQSDFDFLTKKMLGLEVLESPEDLAEKLLLREYSFDSLSSECYQWIKQKSKKLVNSKSSSEFTNLYKQF
jgi:hypothetical protein